MADGTEGWNHLDLESGPEQAAPAASTLANGGRGRVVVLAATPLARGGGWANRAVIAIADAWARSGLRVFLMDLGLDSPSLHLNLGLPNEEGVSDAFLYGASVQRIAVPALDDMIYFASGGTATADPEEILTHSRWDDLAGGFSEADATLLLFLPTDIPGAESILNRASDIIFLASRDDSPDSHLGPAASKVVSILGPQETEVEEPGAAAEEVQAPAPEGPEFGAEAPTTDVGDPDVLTGSDPDPSDPGLEDGFSLAEGFEEGISEIDLGVDATPETAEEVSEVEDPESGFSSGALEAPTDEVVEPLEDLISEESAGMMDGLELGGAFPSDSDGVLGVADVGDFEGPEPVSPAVDVPDFGAEFADLPSLEEETAPELEAGFGEDLVQGGDLGGGAPKEEGAHGPPTASAGADTSGGPETSAEEPARSMPGGGERTRPAPRRRSPPKKRLAPGVLMGILGVLLVVFAAVGTATGIVNVPGFSFLRGKFGEVPLPALTLEGSAVPNEPVIRFSLELFTYEEERLEFAVEMRDDLRAELPNLLFTLVPRESDGVVSHALLAGPAMNLIDVENLKGPLAEVLTREDPDTWPILETPRAFYLGERPSLAEAQYFLAAVEADGIRGYILHVTYPDGQEAYAILSGAFEGVLDARPVQLMLHRNGFPEAPLIERRGRIPE